LKAFDAKMAKLIDVNPQKTRAVEMETLPSPPPQSFPQPFSTQQDTPIEQSATLIK